MMERVNEKMKQNAGPESIQPKRKKFSAIQLQDNRERSVLMQKTAQHHAVQCKPNNTGLPDNLKSGIENLSGHSMDDVNVHYNSSEPAQLNAHAYAQGNQIHVAPGQEKHLPHEAWHVVQQKQGRVRPTKQLKGETNINDDEDLEKEADEMGEKAMRETTNPHEKKKNSVNSPLTTQQKTIQRQLVPSLIGAYMIDDRDPNATQHFTPDPNGVANDYRDQQNYAYTYNPVTMEFLVRGGAPDQYWDTEHQQQLTRTVNATHGTFSIYTTVGNQRFYYHNHLYVAVPNARVCWANAAGRFLDQYNRVLTPDGARVQKHYLIGKDADRNYVLPVKLSNHFNALGANYMPGLPNVVGGNMDPNDADGNATATREMGEETDYNYTNAAPPQPLAAVNQGGNRLHYSTGTVRRTGAMERLGLLAAAPAFVQEMNIGLGEFTFKAHQINYNAGVTTDLQIKQQILNLFAAQKGINLAGAFYTGAVVGRAHTPIQEFLTSESIQQLVNKVKTDHTSYYNGLARARIAQPAQHPLDTEYMAGFNQYTAGATRAQSAQAAQHPGEPAYMAGFNDYTQGLADMRAGNGAANAHAAYMAARNEYTAGLTDIQAGNGAANNHAAYMAARNEYTAGLTDIQAGNGAANNHAAYMAARNEYTAGLADIRAGNGAANAHAAYMQARNQYTAGLTDIQAGNGAANNHAAYMAARNEYTAGLTDIQAGNGAANAHAAYMLARTQYTNGLQDARANHAPAHAHAAYMLAYNQYDAGLTDIQAGNGAANAHAAYMAARQEYIQGRIDGNNGLMFPRMNTWAYTQGYIF